MSAGLHPPQAGLISRLKVRRVKRPSNREMRVRIPPLERSLRTASRHQLSPQPDVRFLRRMPEGLHRIVSARSRVRVPPGPSWGPVAQWVEQEVFPNSRRRNLQAGECRWEYIGGGFGLRFESANSHHPSSPAPIRRANAGRTTWESTCSGRRPAVRFRLRATG